MKRRIRQLWSAIPRPVRIAVGVVLLLAGLTGLVMPILPGWLLIFVGLGALGVGKPAIRWTRRRGRWIKQRVHRFLNRPVCD